MHFPSNESLCSSTTNTSRNRGIGNPLSNHTFFSLDATLNPEFTLLTKNKNNNISSIVEINNSRNNSTFPCYPNEAISNKNIMASPKSKVPDILMINKYYGLVPQKFTISSRKTTNSTPSSAGSSRRSSKSSPSTKPRAKSSTHQSYQNRHERRPSEDSKGFRSENDSPEPIKMIVVPRQASTNGCESPMDKLSDPFGPVTKKMSVERYKKWKNCGGGKARNMVIRTNSDIGQTLSLLDNGLPGAGFNNSHATNNNRASTATEYMANRRVIKIDLNRVSSCDEENYRITTSSQESTCTRGENKEPRLKVVANNSAGNNASVFDVCLSSSRSRNTSTGNIYNSNSFSCSDYSFSNSAPSMSSRQEKTSPISTSRPDNNGSYSCLVNNDNNDCNSTTVTNDDQEEQTTLFSSTSGETTDSGSENLTTVRDSSTFNSCGTSLELSSLSVTKESMVVPKEEAHERKELLPKTNEKDDDNNGSQTDKKDLVNNDMIGCGESGLIKGHDKKVASMQRCGKLSSRTISFDDKILEMGEHGSLQDGMSSSRSELPVKRRPTTASARCSIKTFPTPNGFNPPSKVIPWTQQKSAGGKALTLAERRAKFQRAPSIHSSSSMSMETGEEEAFSEIEISSPSARPPSSAFREFRKPLHVTQPPEIPTMISQINPNADEDIQIEIEKVALMLRKMQSMKPFSMSLDSGIEAGMARASSSPEEAMSFSKTKTYASTESISQIPEVENALKASFSESSVSSSDSQTSGDDEHHSKLGNQSTSAKSTNGNANPEDVRSAKVSYNTLTTRQCPLNNSQKMLNHRSRAGSTEMNKIGPVTSQSLNSASPSKIGSASTTPSLPVSRKPPLRKAVSISCEKELLKADGDKKGNEVNFNDNGKSVRPKTATATQRSNVSGTVSIHNNYPPRKSSLSAGESHQSTGTAVATNAIGSQGSRNRKILIKKALMEINQSSVNMKKKWASLGRPRTAPSLDKSNNTSHQIVTRPQAQQLHRKPMKASPFPISSNAKIGLSSSGKSTSIGGGKADNDVMQRDQPSEKTGPTGQIQRSSSEAPTEQAGDNPVPGSPLQTNGENLGKGRSTFRQCFSLDESALLGFSIKSVNGIRIPIFEKLASAESTESCPTSIMDDDVSFLSSKKREQCLKVYEKMMKTGCTIKLETIFRGMLTPSEYRAFIRAAERASQEVEEEISQLAEESSATEINSSLANAEPSGESKTN